MCDGFHFTESHIATDADIIIGMDLILAGDLAISNGGGRTIFCFSMPPHEKALDLVDRQDKVNKRFKKKKH
jgi:hypothetical protein